MANVKQIRIANPTMQQAVLPIFFDHMLKIKLLIYFMKQQYISSIANSIIPVAFPIFKILLLNMGRENQTTPIKPTMDNIMRNIFMAVSFLMWIKLI